MKYDIFISYRRSSGKNYARTIKPELEKRGYNVFLDFDELSDGVFDRRIMDAINEAPVFLMILSEGALDRCVNEDDWVRAEILYAKEVGKHIVPIEVDKTFRKMPETVPEEIRSLLGAHQFSQIDTETLLQESMDKLVEKRIDPYVKGSSYINPRIPKNSADVHIEVDAGCELYRFREHLDSILPDEDNTIYLKPGRHKLTFITKEFADVKETVVINIPSENYSDFIELSFAERLAERRIKHQQEIEKQKEEAQRLFIEAEEAFAKGREKEAFALYKKSAEQGNPYAQCNLGMMYDNDPNINEDDVLAVKWYRAAAEQGLAVAQYNLGVMYMNGWGVEQDEAVAVAWYRQAAMQGYVAAQYNLGVMYKHGRGIAADDIEAVKWYRKAAEQGDADAQTKLGWMYDKGRGVMPSRKEAKKWFKKAADQGHTNAQYNLGLINQFGRSVPVDDSEGVKWHRHMAHLN